MTISKTQRPSPVRGLLSRDVDDNWVKYYTTDPFPGQRVMIDASFPPSDLHGAGRTAMLECGKSVKTAEIVQICPKRTSAALDLKIVRWWYW